MSAAPGTDRSKLQYNPESVLLRCLVECRLVTPGQRQLRLDHGPFQYAADLSPDGLVTCANRVFASLTDFVAHCQREVATELGPAQLDPWASVRHLGTPLAELVTNCPPTARASPCLNSFFYPVLPESKAWQLYQSWRDHNHPPHLRMHTQQCTVSQALTQLLPASAKRLSAVARADGSSVPPGTDARPQLKHLSRSSIASRLSIPLPVPRASLNSDSAVPSAPLPLRSTPSEPRQSDTPPGTVRSGTSANSNPRARPSSIVLPAPRVGLDQVPIPVLTPADKPPPSTMSATPTASDEKARIVATSHSPQSPSAPDSLKANAVESPVPDSKAAQTGLGEQVDDSPSVEAHPDVIAHPQDEREADLKDDFKRPSKDESKDASKNDLKDDVENDPLVDTTADLEASVKSNPADSSEASQPDSGSLAQDGPQKACSQAESKNRGAPEPEVEYCDTVHSEIVADPNTVTSGFIMHATPDAWCDGFSAKEDFVYPDTQHRPLYFQCINSPRSYNCPRSLCPLRLATTQDVDLHMRARHGCTLSSTKVANTKIVRWNKPSAKTVIYRIFDQNRRPFPFHDLYGRRIDTPSYFTDHPELFAPADQDEHAPPNRSLRSAPKTGQPETPGSGHAAKRAKTNGTRASAMEHPPNCRTIAPSREYELVKQMMSFLLSSLFLLSLSLSHSLSLSLSFAPFFLSAFEKFDVSLPFMFTTDDQTWLAPDKLYLSSGCKARMQDRLNALARLEDALDASDVAAWPVLVGKGGSHHQTRLPIRLAVLKSRRQTQYNPYTLIECNRFDENVHVCPFRVQVDGGALLLMEFHSHMATTEIIGFLGGTYDAKNQLLTVSLAVPCAAMEEDAFQREQSVEMAPESGDRARHLIEKRGMTVVGWYHSHPAFCPNPSLRDIENQQSFQQFLTKDTDNEPFVGIIAAPYHRLQSESASEKHAREAATLGDIRCFWVDRSHATEFHGTAYGTPMHLDYEVLVQEQIDDHLFADLINLCNYYEVYASRADMSTAVVDGMSRLEKLRSCLIQRLPQTLSKSVRDDVASRLTSLLNMADTLAQFGDDRLPSAQPSETPMPQPKTEVVTDVGSTDTPPADKMEVVS
ncbi:uncharacterized protein MONBRDRAFT_26083 [Monosiga brevicollis MX1]|uniref:MPN domain-containing protein n=1 Tax=Monosiga brevicollis TaxID=81824 RepID=A9V1B6_MONBE|nr:uncharacterized protein MONBRDRAFT_26083 [Monosiga brevicollis MX1]EDQ88779.1 predicted protein [Monosiga brevicollis MX1]|eukprot:XP_001746392.1 hypothetical protein [Monosiga brevicollis MX1]